MLPLSIVLLLYHVFGALTQQRDEPHGLDGRLDIVDPQDVGSLLQGDCVDDRGAVERARQNAEHAGVMAGRALKSIGIDSHVWRPDFQVADFKEIEAPFESGMIICNPPYGERLGDEEQAALLYKEMGSLFTDFKGWQIGVITAHKEFQENIGRYATSLKSLKAGNLDTTFYMYDGTEKEKKFKTKKARVEY